MEPASNGPGSASLLQQNFITCFSSLSGSSSAAKRASAAVKQPSSFLLVCSVRPQPVTQEYTHAEQMEDADARTGSKCGTETPGIPEWTPRSRLLQQILKIKGWTQQIWKLLGLVLHTGPLTSCVGYWTRLDLTLTLSEGPAPASCSKTYLSPLEESLLRSSQCLQFTPRNLSGVFNFVLWLRVRAFDPSSVAVHSVDHFYWERIISFSRK